ncbi:MAG: hypothetical protein KAU20_03570 [Nanoarchaeota archaeon]|nr:hypothetical protein [Nanoarchaeota archaeon]
MIKGLAGKTTRKEAEEMQELPLEIMEIKNYVSACLSKTSSEGISLLGKQGGKIWKNQGGIYSLSKLTPGKTYMEFIEGSAGHNISYGLNNNEFNLTCNLTQARICKKDPPDYPWIGFPDNQPQCTDAYSYGCFGAITLPSLYGKEQMYEQIAAYVNNTIEDCMNFSVFEEKGFEINKAEEMKVNVTTTDETVIVVLEYPLEIIDPTSKKLIRLKYFYYDTLVRLEKLHTIARAIINKDIKDVSFDISLATSITFPGLIDDNISINVIRDGGNVEINPYNDDSVVRIRDGFSRISTPPYVFQFARQNRVPALEYIGSMTEEQCNNKTFTAYDPDEDTVTITCVGSKVTVRDSGMLEDYEENIDIVTP